MGLRTLRVVLGDQLSRGVAALADADPADDTVLMAEVWDEATYVRHHPKKIAFLFAAMRHFAEALRAEGFTVHYTALDESDNRHSLRGELKRAADAYKPDQIVCTFPGEWRVAEDMRGWEKATGLPVEIREDDRFFCSRAAFKRWIKDRKAPRMEHFYREMRRHTGLLMGADGEPAGGQWNFDQDNRQSLPADLAVPESWQTQPDAITRDVLDLVEARFGDHFGDLRPFSYGVSRQDALAALDDFVANRLGNFGAYQDAMATGQATLFHSLLSLYLNAGLLLPSEVCARAARSYYEDGAPLNAVEGFIRQILGWREYVRGIYWTFMPEYAARNGLDAGRPLPDFYWTGETDMHCLAEAIGQTKRFAYAHHIQRLMVTGNFALLAGIDPAAVNEWYLIVYADAYEWVELPNVSGMALHADGGLLGSKPYAASGKYIDRMSDYCGQCRYRVKDTTGPDACPFNYLYWNFLVENEDKFRRNRRMAPIYGTLDRMKPEKVEAMTQQARAFLDEIAA